jgi:hypothetical protein
MVAEHVGGYGGKDDDDRTAGHNRFAPVDTLEVFLKDQTESKLFTRQDDPLKVCEQEKGLGS